MISYHDSGQGESFAVRAAPSSGMRMAKKVLIVEDNELNMKLFHDLLDAQGYETLQTREGLQALALARQHHPDLILMDIQLPEISGPGGHQVAEGRRRPWPTSR